jgi:hypothetical protein
MEQTLVLNATYEPLRIVSWQKAITLLFQGKVEVIAVYDREIRGVTVRVKLPSVLAPAPSRPYETTIRRRSLLAEATSTRGTITAASTAARGSSPSQLTFDHVLPVARGGHKGLGQHRDVLHPRATARRAIARPERRGCSCCASPSGPAALPSLTVSLGIHRTPPSWRDYLYWDLKLEAG